MPSGDRVLVRRTGLSERSVEYYLGMLREAGLLAYIVRAPRLLRWSDLDVRDDHHGYLGFQGCFSW